MKAIDSNASSMGAPKEKSVLAQLVPLFCIAFIASYNENNVNVALPQIMLEFGADAVLAQWLVSGYMLVSAIVVTAFPFLFKRLSTRKLFFFGIFCLGAGLIASYFALSFPILLASRLFQAIGTGVFIPFMISVLMIVTPETKRGTYMAIGSSIITLGPAFAPVFCGFFVDAFGWRSSVFLPLAAVIMLGLIGFFTTKNVTEAQAAKIDIPSLVLSPIALFSLIYALSIITTDTVPALIILAISVVFGALFAKRQFKLEEPLFDLSPLKNADFWPAVVLCIVAMMISFSTSVLLPLFFQDACNVSATLSGIFILVPLFIAAGTAFVAGKLLDKFGAFPLLPVGYFVAAAGMLGMAGFGWTQNYIIVFVFSIFAFGGVGIVMAQTQTTALTALDQSEFATGTSLIQIATVVSACISPSLYVGILSSISAAQTATGTALMLANAFGFSAAAIVAGIIGIAGFLFSLKYAYKMRKKN